ncbi:TauD/TfdA family dioxygenase [Frankia sp. CcI49]|uniref:TauD/TfdA family dioxygenase n=1 Tax=Frankia sp. CcI49 TaxID=1745382 RepID=UPI000977B44A|nr:TauD/TfdA family dioxygenase [Frankia sp. CcI49]
MEYSDDPPVIRSYLAERDSLIIEWNTGQASRFHNLWLRDNCACARCGPHDRGSRHQLLLDIPEDIAPSSVSVRHGKLKVVWSHGGHRSEYDPLWLHAHSYGSSVVRGRNGLRKTLWDSALGEWPSVRWDRISNDRAERHRLHACVVEFGFVLVRGLGTENDAIERLGEEIGYIRETHYGRVFDLVTRVRPTILADLAGSLPPHTDEVYRSVPTGINIFHCITSSPDGGGISQLVDGHRVAAHLEEHHPDDFELLTRVPVRHERRIQGQVIIAENPPITLDFRGEVAEVRLNERTMTALRADQDLMLPTYLALRMFLRIAYDPIHRIEYLLKPGEALVLDNLRVLHGRSAYKGARHLRQAQVMRDEFFAKFTALTEEMAAGGDGGHYEDASTS